MAHNYYSSQEQSPHSNLNYQERRPIHNRNAENATNNGARAHSHTDNYNYNYYNFSFQHPGSYNINVGGIRPGSTADYGSQTQATGQFSNHTGSSGVQNQNGFGFTFHPHNSQPVAYGPNSFLTPISGGLPQHQINQPNYGQNSSALDALAHSTPFMNQNPPQNDGNVHLARAFFSALRCNGIGGGCPIAAMPNQTVESRLRAISTNTFPTVDEEDDDDAHQALSSSQIRRPRLCNNRTFGSSLPNSQQSGQYQRR